MREEDFKKYITAVDALYREKSHKYDCLFSPEEELSSVGPLLHGIMYILDSFLNSDNSSLFIKIPSFNFGKKDKDKENNHCRFTKAISDVLYASASDVLVSYTKESNINDGDTIFISTKIPLKESRGTDNSERFFTICNDDKGRRAVEISSLRSSINWVHYPIKENYEIFVEKYNSYVLKLSRTPEGQWKSIVEKLNNLFTGIGIYNSCRVQQQYKKILFVGTQKYFQSSFINTCDYITSPVTFTNDFNKVKSNPDFKDYELIVFTDNSHINHTSAIQDKLNSRRDSLRKVVYIGTDCDKRYDCQFEFSNREWFHYFVGDTKYPTIVRKYVDFPWLKKSISSLKEILEEDAELSLDAKRIIIHRVFYPFMNAQIPEDIRDESRILDIIGDEYGGLLINTAVLEKVLIWYRSLDVPVNSPKTTAIKQISSKHTRVFIIPRDKSSYKRDVTKFLRTKNAKDNCYIFEGIRRCKMEVFEDLLELVAMGTYYFLYYDLADIKYLEDYLISDDETYNNDYRLNLLDRLIPQRFVNDQPSLKTLDDFLEANLFDDIEYKSWSSVNNSYQVVFSNGVEEILQGEIISDNKSINLDEIYEGGNFRGKAIKYYKSPENFGELISLYKGQLGHDETFYSNLWKSSLRKLYEDVADSDINKLSAMLPGVSKSVLRPYIKSEKSPLFMQSKGSMRRICKMLGEHGYLNNDEINHILGAKKSREENTKLGRALKQELFDYVLKRNSEHEYDIVKRITDWSKKKGRPIIVDDLVASSLFEGTIISIKEYKQQDNG